MKDSEFIELLNLYLDHEISAVDAARLEAEVQSNPSRRRIYEDYCRMQKACHILAHEFQTVQPVAATNRKVVDFNTAARRSRASFYTAGAFAAAAACMAIIFVGQNRQQDALSNVSAPTVVQTAPAEPARSANAVMVAHTTTAPASNASALRGVAPERRSLNRELSFAADPQSQALLVASVEQANAQFEWLRNFKLAPLPQNTAQEELRLEVCPTLQTEPKTYRSRQPVNAAVEMTAFRFQR